MREKELLLEINGQEYKVIISEFTAAEAKVSVNGKDYTVGLRDLGIEQVAEVKPIAPPEAIAPKPEISAKKPVAAKPLHRPKSLAMENAIVAPLPGQLIKVFVKEGDTITAGQKVCVLEAMKMENEVNATASGMIIDIKFREGDSVNQGDVLILLKPVEN